MIKIEHLIFIFSVLAIASALASSNFNDKSNFAWTRHTDITVARDRHHLESNLVAVMRSLVSHNLLGFDDQIGEQTIARHAYASYLILINDQKPIKTADEQNAAVAHITSFTDYFASIDEAKIEETKKRQDEQERNSERYRKLGKFFGNISLFFQLLTALLALGLLKGK